MKEVNIKLIPAVFLFLAILVSIFLGKNSSSLVSAFDFNKNINNKIKVLIEQNKDKELISNENFNQKFIYLAFQKDNEITSYILDIDTGEEKDLLHYIKKEKRDAFQQKINDFLYLKYPEFIVDVLVKDESKKMYQLLKNELGICYNKEKIEPKVKENLCIFIPYNEIKDMPNFTVAYDVSYESEKNNQENKKAVALTFDDGPNSEKTNRIVDILEKNKAHATFFMVGNRMEYGRETILNVLNKGNEIGSHSYNHKNMKRMKLADVIYGEEKTKEIYYKITGKEFLYTRVPYGNITNKIKDNLDTIFINWNLDTEDWLHRNKDHIIKYVMENVSDGDIILMHDLYDSTVEAVEELLPLLYAEGYQVVTISELAKLKGKTLENHEVYRSIKSD